ncbi:PREDICTED: uncharacterized protein LOC106146570, partial [Chinchilla lanigera]|uniref:uncharacterized protein LOC106146570 n=1 Tax=Chinchilla lanigera TaxID=34839 RepID=UPI0006976E70
MEQKPSSPLTLFKCSDAFQVFSSPPRLASAQGAVQTQKFTARCSGQSLREEGAQFGPHGNSPAGPVQALGTPWAVLLNSPRRNARRDEQTDGPGNTALEPSGQLRLRRFGGAGSGAVHLNAGDWRRLGEAAVFAAGPGRLGAVALGPGEAPRPLGWPGRPDPAQMGRWAAGDSSSRADRPGAGAVGGARGRGRSDADGAGRAWSAGAG